GRGLPRRRRRAGGRLRVLVRVRLPSGLGGLGAVGVLRLVHSAHSPPAASTAAAAIAGSVQVSGAPSSTGAPGRRRAERCTALTPVRRTRSPMSAGRTPPPAQ